MNLMNTKIMNKQERYNKIVSIKDKLNFFKLLRYVY